MPKLLIKLDFHKSFGLFCLCTYNIMYGICSIVLDIELIWLTNRLRIKYSQNDNELNLENTGT